MAALTRAWVSAEIGRRPLSTYETVLIETPAARATSLIVGIALPVLLAVGLPILLTVTTGTPAPPRRGARDHPAARKVASRTPAPRTRYTSCRPRIRSSRAVTV